MILMADSFNANGNLDEDVRKEYNKCTPVGESFIAPYKNEKAGAMSFAGIIFAQGYITGFADKRSSVKTGDVLSDDREKPEVTKVFKNDCFVITFTGTNAIYTSRNPNLKKYYLSTWVDNNINQFTAPDDLCEQLWYWIREKAFRTKFDDIVAIAGYKSENEELVCITARINYNGIKIEKTVVAAPYARYDGDDLYRAQFHANPEPFFISDADIIRKRLEHMEDTLDFGDHYRTVCRPWEIEQIPY